MTSGFRLRPSGLLSAAGVLVSAVSVAALAGRFSWVLDLASHFRVQYAIGLTVGAVVLLMVRQRRIAALVGCVAILNLSLLAPYYFGRVQKAGAGDPTIRLVLVNVNTANERYDLVGNFIRAADPDVVALQEVNDVWMREMNELRQAYPHVIAEPRRDNFGIALFSKRPLARAEIIRSGEFELPSIVVESEAGGRRFSLLTMHPLPPRGREGTRLRDDQLRAAAEVLNKIHGPKIFLGDLNVSPWSSLFRELLNRTGLHDSAIGRGIQPTWPTMSRLLRVPIDHCLISPEVIVVDRKVGSDVGSDHYPLVVEVALSR